MNTDSGDVEVMRTGGFNEILSQVLVGDVITVLVAGRLDVYTLDWNPHFFPRGYLSASLRGVPWFIHGEVGIFCYIPA